MWMKTVFARGSTSTVQQRQSQVSSNSCFVCCIVRNRDMIGCLWVKKAKLVVRHWERERWREREWERESEWSETFLIKTYMTIWSTCVTQMPTLTKDIYIETIHEHVCIELNMWSLWSAYARTARHEIRLEHKSTLTTKWMCSYISN